MAADRQVSRDMSLSTLLEDEGIKNNATCSEIRALVKRQVEILKAEDLKLIGDDTTLVRMINFFAEYKKRQDEWRKKQERKDKNKLIAQMVNEENAKDDVSRREMNLHKIKLKPFYKGELSEENQDDLERQEQEKLKREASMRESTMSTRLTKDPNIIRDRSVRGNDRYYEPDVPENVLFVDDASLAGDPSVAETKYYLTEGNRSVSGKRKVTLNLKIPKSKLANLKNIRALIRTRDPITHALMTKEKTFILDKIDEAAGESKSQRKYRFKSNLDSGKESIHEKSTDLTSQIPSLGGDSKLKAPIRLEKMEFARPNHLPNLGGKPLVTKGSKEFGNGTLDKRKGMFFVFIGDPKNEFVT